MLPPLGILWPQGCRTERTAHALDVHHIGHAALGMYLAALTLEVLIHRQRPIRASSTDTFGRRMRDIFYAWSESVNILTQTAVDGFGWETFISTAIETDAGMTTHTAQVVAGIVEEHHIVVGVRTIGGIGEPKVLPDHDAMTIASLVERFVAYLSHPVAYHREVHVAMIPHGNVIFARTIEQIVFVEAPVASQRNETTTIDKDLQAISQTCVAHLAQTSLIIDRG